MKTISRAIVVVLLSLCAVACAGRPSIPGSVSYQEPVYRLAVGDRLKITVFGEEALSREYVISPQGDLSFPLLGDIAAQGKTIGELQGQIAQELASGYLNDPRVTAEVINFRPFYILGEVQKAGEYPYSAGLTVLQAVAQAGGFTYRANQGKVLIRRAGEAQDESYDLRDGRPVYVSPGDTIIFTERYF